jgi:hypothetical protein
MATINPVWQAYNDFHNEGGEGYNPHEKYIETGKGEPLWSKLDSKASRLQDIANATSISDPRWQELTDEVKVLRAAAKAARAQNI